MKIRSRTANRGLAIDGTVALPSDSYTNDPDTGRWRPAANTLAWSVNGAESMRLTSAGGLEFPGGKYIALRGTSIVQAAESNSYRLSFNSGTNTELNTGTYIAFGTDAAGEAARIISAGNFGIGTATPNANALLDVTSTTKAFMPPRMTTTQKNAIASPTAGMVVYDSTLNKLAVYTGAAWETVTSI